MPAAEVQGGADEFARAQACGALGRFGIRGAAVAEARQHRKPGGRSHFNDGFLAADRELGRDRLARGSGDRRAAAGEAGADGGVESPLAAVGHWNESGFKALGWQTRRCAASGKTCPQSGAQAAGDLGS
ncbi:hypothetical protein AHiyo8_41990 [Arthrobacter sp. Hiyo8]|nr:hypothetical protein AHiyo8_41990 [Arthrobacter sp. Hiyo8]